MLEADQLLLNCSLRKLTAQEAIDHGSCNLSVLFGQVQCSTRLSGAIDAFGICRMHSSNRGKLNPCDTSSLISALIVLCPCRTDLWLPWLSMNVISSLHYYCEISASGNIAPSCKISFALFHNVCLWSRGSRVVQSLNSKPKEQEKFSWAWIALPISKSNDSSITVFVFAALPVRLKLKSGFDQWGLADSGVHKLPV